MRVTMRVTLIDMMMMMMIMRVIIRVRTNDDETHGEIDAERICKKP